MTMSIRNILQQHPQFKIKEKFNFFRKYSTVPEALRSHVSIFWFNSWLFNGCCLWDILISMSKLSSSRAHLFFVMIWPIFENPRSTTASAWGIITYIASKRWMFGKTQDTTQSLRRSSRVTGFFTLATTPSISISSFLLRFLCRIFICFL